ncbi:hypothetical protein C8Q74DRAFT_1256330 [Fomes fomentarius]|nr:hypothetical protein C8Q74DRAFT_1256330 [Fomes fomentarius]
MTHFGPAAQIFDVRALKIPALDDTFGAVLLGTFVGLLLYGTALHQSYRYFRIYVNDRTLLKVLVIVVLLFDTFNTYLSAHISYHYLVTNYFMPFNLLFGSWSVRILPLSSGLVICTSQSFFARRVVVIGKQYKPVAAIAIALLFGELGFFAAATAEAFMLPNFQTFRSVTWLISCGSAMAVTADLLLTTVLIISLRKSRTGIRRTDSMVDFLVLYAVNTGLVTGLFNILSFVFSIAMPSKLIYYAVGIAGTKLYAVTLLAALNARQSLNAQGMLTFGTVTETAGARSIGFRMPMRRTADLDTEAAGVDTIVSGARNTNTVFELKPASMFSKSGATTSEQKNAGLQA